MRGVITTIVMKNSLEHDEIFELVNKAETNVDLIGAVSYDIHLLPRYHFSQKVEVGQLDIDVKISVHICEIQIVRMLSFDPPFMLGYNRTYNFDIFF